MDRQQLSEWLRHPTTKELVILLDEHLAACKDALLNSPIEASNIGMLNKLKGQIHTLEMVRDIEDFLLERVKKPKEDIEDVEDV